MLLRLLFALLIRPKVAVSVTRRAFWQRCTWRRAGACQAMRDPHPSSVSASLMPGAGFTASAVRRKRLSSMMDSVKKGDG